MRSSSCSHLYFAAINTNAASSLHISSKPFKSPFLKAIITGATGIFGKDNGTSGKEEKKQATLRQLFTDRLQRG
ncbi:MAG: hypothetical protein IPH18_05455 [Chitinophagaceae bacterium]|nr:hypothetical protein [Chitinophagaceae bacterium]MBK8951353.1 hypothetical protein [Chitinophagaceae bacterium]